MHTDTLTPSTDAPRHPASPWQAAARACAGFLGGFTLLNLLGNARTAHFDANLWWIDIRPLPAVAGDVLLAGAAVCLLAFALRPGMGAMRRGVTLACLVVLAGMTVHNAAAFYALLACGVIATPLPVPISLLITGLLALIAHAVLRPPPARRLHVCAFVLTLLACLIGYPLVQMYGFGKTDYRRQADIIVVFGAKAFADGRPSSALRDRVTTACTLYQQGYAPRLLFSGGPAEGTMHETEAMRRLAMSLGVPTRAILLDRDGLDTRATVGNSGVLCRRLHLRRMIAVSNFYHLPRVKLAYQRDGWEVYTVPAVEPRPYLRQPLMTAREVVALWAYYLGPLTGHWSL